MPRRRRRRSFRKRSNLQLYLLVTLACGALAVAAHFLFEAPAAVRSYAECRRIWLGLGSKIASVERRLLQAKLVA